MGRWGRLRVDWGARRGWLRRVVAVGMMETVKNEGSGWFSDGVCVRYDGVGGTSELVLDVSALA